MGRDDWKYDEEMWDEKGAVDDEPAKRRTEKQCPQCLHWLPVDATHCGWCGKVVEDPKRP